MARYFIGFRGASQHAGNPEDKKNLMAEWNAWVEGLGDAITIPPTPLGNGRAITLDGVSEDRGANALDGFLAIEADSLDLALEIARRCPHLKVGSIEFGEMRSM